MTDLAKEKPQECPTFYFPQLRAESATFCRKFARAGPRSVACGVPAPATVTRP
jgi:hypothetical protein